MTEKPPSDPISTAVNQLDIGAQAARFVRLLSGCERRLFSYVLALVGNLADADEIVQETNLRLWQQFGEFRSEADFGSWACTIAHYQVLTFRKRSGHGRLQLSDAFFSKVSAEIARRTDELDARQHALGDCLDRLRTSDREFVLKCYSGQATIEQIAANVGRSAAGAYQSLWRIRNNLRHCIEQRLQMQGGHS